MGEGGNRLHGGKQPKHGLANDWLTWDLDELAATCAAMEIAPAAGLELQVPRREARTELCWDRSFGFGVGAEARRGAS
ncbi:hypothetical protein [Azovibrio restrictus]|uniref:hypothetical protein n=1 Tax=Azovibrio restrictus TaxID=146938 RepID=UPI0026E9A735|nr:hypothetical protein [Azovibrio restrictus]MDD3483755.1 hypothetical protein [Azovibrio restrictus]